MVRSDIYSVFQFLLSRYVNILPSKTCFIILWYFKSFKEKMLTMYTVHDMIKYEDIQLEYPEK